MLHNFIHRIAASFALIMILGFSSSIVAQTFDQARDYAFNGQREKARDICREILSQGFNSDVALLMGRTYAWDGKYDSARIVLNNVLVQKPQSLEAFSALADVEYWSENYKKAIDYCNQALVLDSLDADFILKKAKIQHSYELYEEAVTTLEDYYHLNPGNAEVVKKLKEYRLDLMKNSVKLSYTIDLFDDDFNRDPWQIAAFSYSRKTKLGSVILRANRAIRFGTTGYQFEMDAYPKLGENNYGYLNYGFSQNSIFPEHRLGLEWYHNFPKAYEGSIGLRTLFFGSSDVTIYTATFGKYVGNYWVSLRSFVTPGDDGTSVSGLMLMRRYFSDPENYIGLRLGYGISPDDNRNFIDSGQKLTLKSRSFRMEFNHIFNHVWILNTGAVWGNEERLAGTYSGYYTFDISIARLF